VVKKKPARPAADTRRFLADLLAELRRDLERRANVMPDQSARTAIREVTAALDLVGHGIDIDS